MAAPAETTFGGVMIALFFAFILYGITILQTFIYFQKYPSDRFALKALVVTVWILETVHTAFCMKFIYAYLVEGFGNDEVLLDIHWGIGVSVAASTGIALCVQGFSTRRIWIGELYTWVVLRKCQNVDVFDSERKHIGLDNHHRNPYPLPMWLRDRYSSVIKTASITHANEKKPAASVLAYRHPRWEAFRHDITSFVAISGGLASSALADILVALTLTFYLKRRKNDWQKQSNSMINRILFYAVNTGAITAACSLFCGVLFASCTPTFSSPSGISSVRFTNPRPDHMSPVGVLQHTTTQDDSMVASGSVGDLNFKNMKGGELA
ncbi:hypothetical protein C8Q70DRAFT_513500 [Cubamyces menziesii]|nr:hypothetical protein C8Q70DRAFT_513500 [Cubamyces menziesii]